MTVPTTECIQIGNRIYRILFPDLLPAHAPSQLNGLRQAIIDYGIRYPIVLDTDRGVLDGATRIRIAKDLNLSEDDIPEVIARTPQTPEQKEELAWVLNFHRRHMTPTQLEASSQERAMLLLMRRQDVVHLHETGQSTYQIAEAVGVSQTQVRRDLAQATREREQEEQRPVPRPRATPPPEINGVFPTRTATTGENGEQRRALYDSEEVAVPENLRDVFEDRHKIQACCAKIREARKSFEELCSSPAGTLVLPMKTQMSNDLNRMANEIYQNRPYAICPRCEGRGDGCPVCRSKGWIQKAVFSQPGIGRAAQ